MTESKPKHCGSFRAGHMVHHIQARLSGEEPGRSGQVSLDDDSWLLVDAEGATTRWWSHDTEHVQALIAETGGAVMVRPHGVLAFERPWSASLVCIARGPSPCPDPDEDVGDLLLTDLIEQRGGFLVRGDLVLNKDS